MRFEVGLDLANVIELVRVGRLGRLQDHPRRIGLGTLGLVLFVQPFELGFDKLEALLDSIDLAADSRRPIVKVYDLLRLVTMLAFGPVAFEGVVRMLSSDLGKSFVDKTRCPRGFAKCLFLLGDLGGETAFDLDGLGKLLLKTLDGVGKMAPFGRKKRDVRGQLKARPGLRSGDESGRGQTRHVERLGELSNDTDVRAGCLRIQWKPNVKSKHGSVHLGREKADPDAHTVKQLHGVESAERVAHVPEHRGRPLNG
jgi:hypothetical protein